MLDPVAVYAAILSTITAVYGLLTNRTRLRCVLSVDWPDPKPVPMSDAGVDPGDAYLRMDVINEGRRPTAVVRGGLVTSYDERPLESRDPIRSVLNRLTRRVAPVARGHIGHIPLTYAGTRREARLGEHETWSVSRRAREVAYELAASGRGQQRVVGAYVQLMSGRVLYWAPAVLRGRGTIDALHQWRGGYYDAYPEDRPVPPEADSDS